MCALSLCPVPAVEVSGQGSSVPWERRPRRPWQEPRAARLGGAVGGQRGKPPPGARARGGFQAEPGCGGTREVRMREKGCPPGGARECRDRRQRWPSHPGAGRTPAPGVGGGGLALVGPDYVPWVVSSSHPFATCFPGAALGWQSRPGANHKSTAPGECENPVCLSYL